MPSLVDLPGGSPAPGSASFEALLDVSLPVAIEIGRATMTVQEILDLSVGSVVQLDRIVGEPVDIYVSDRRIAQGEVVVVGEHFGVRITRVLTPTGSEQAAA
jgi:flagellar motor switch protein FliN/FliY